MYAILQQGGHQYRVAPGDRLIVDRVDAEVGDVVTLEPVLLVHDGEAAVVGAPVVDGARVAATVVSHRLGRKLRIFKYKPKKRYRRTQGHRSRLTELRIDALLGKGEALPAPAGAARPSPDAEPSPAAAPAPRARAARARAEAKE